MDTGSFSELVGKIYEDDNDAAAMRELAPAIARAFDTHSAMLYLHKKPTPIPEFERLLSGTRNFDEWAFRSYGQYYHARDEWYVRGIRKPLGFVNIGEEMISDAQFARTEFCNDFCAPLDTFRVIGTSFAVDDTLASIGIHRTRRARRFDEGDRKMLGLLVPHLQRAAQIHRRLQLAERNCAATFGLIDGLAIGVVLVDRTGRILFANSAAERALQAGRGLTVWQGHLRAEHVGQGPTLARLIAEAAQTGNGHAAGSGGLLKLRSRAGAALHILVAPLRTGSGAGLCDEPAALVVLSDPEAPGEIPEQALCAVHGLTPAEARLAVRLAAGDTLSAYAERNGISLNTAKSHLRQALAKTGCSRQSDLMRLIHSDLAMRLSRFVQRTHPFG